jgi:hypothetical protein
MDADGYHPWYVVLSLLWLTFWLGWVMSNLDVYIHARINPGNAFRLVLKVAKYTTDVESCLVEMADQEHELWLDRSIGYSFLHFMMLLQRLSGDLARHCHYGFWTLILVQNGELEGMSNGSQ